MNCTESANFFRKINNQFMILQSLKILIAIHIFIDTPYFYRSRETATSIIDNKRNSSLCNYSQY